eukprot:FR744062.1.p1 GENE.FR744062.1~~FR744062.1.p1  ORF type:complete len:284 (+),score=27.88 FR744062.1:70-852(+)
MVGAGGSVSANLLLTLPLPAARAPKPLSCSVAGDQGLTTKTRTLLIQALTATAEQSAAIDEEAIFSVLSAAQEFLDKSEEERDNRHSENSPAATPEPAVSICRRAIYSHHIIADTKRQAARENAIDLDLGGLVKHGWPGLIVVEGSIENVDEYERRLKRFKWQHLEARGESVELVPPGQTIDTMRALPRGFEELGAEHSAIAVMAEQLRAAGLEEVFLNLLRLEHVSPVDTAAATATGTAEASTQELQFPSPQVKAQEEE